MAGKLREADKVNDAGRAKTMREYWTRDHRECLMGDDGDLWQRKAARFDTKQRDWHLDWRQKRIAPPATRR